MSEEVIILSGAEGGRPPSPGGLHQRDLVEERLWITQSAVLVLLLFRKLPEPVVILAAGVAGLLLRA